jgi:hypothetical protein
MRGRAFDPELRATVFASRLSPTKTYIDYTGDPGKALFGKRSSIVQYYPIFWLAPRPQVDQTPELPIYPVL